MKLRLRLFHKKTVKFSTYGEAGCRIGKNRNASASAEDEIEAIRGGSFLRQKCVELTDKSRKNHLKARD